MPNRAKSILDAVVGKLTGLGTTGANVKASRAYAVSVTPALTIRMGSEEIEEYNPARVRKAREIIIVIHVADKETSVDSTILQIEAEIWAALAADVKQGLAYVTDTSFLKSEEVEVEPGAKVSGQVEQTWLVQYSHSNLSTEA